MKMLETKITECGKILPGDVLKVDSFVNHQIDVDLMDACGAEWYSLYATCNITKILTIEASGIGIACLAARHFKVPVVFAKKSKTSNMSADFYAAEAQSYTHGNSYHAMVSKNYLTKDDTVLIIDDFLATGSATEALLDLCNQAGATVAGIGIVIEKAYQDGGKNLRAKGIRVESLARIASMSPEDGITFC